MIIDVVICRADGSQEIEKREVGEDWFPAAHEEAVENGGV